MAAQCPVNLIVYDRANAWFWVESVFVAGSIGRVFVVSSSAVAGSTVVESDIFAAYLRNSNMGRFDHVTAT